MTCPANSEELKRMIEDAIASGKRTIVPAGVTSIVKAEKQEKPVKIPVVFCGPSFNVKGHYPSLQKLDGDWS